MSTDPTTPTTERADPQQTIDELHRALWLTLWMNGGEVVVCPDELQDMPPPGAIEWLTADDRQTKIIRIQDDKIRERAL